VAMSLRTNPCPMPWVLEAVKVTLKGWFFVPGPLSGSKEMPA